MVEDVLSSSTEIIETNTVKLIFQVSPDKLEKGVQSAYLKNKNSISIQGFRKGKVPRAFIEKIYGKSFFYNHAIDFILEDVYTDVLREHKLNPVKSPKMEIKEISDKAGVIFEFEMVVEPLLKINDYFGIKYKPFETNVT